ncbi:MAG TPA: hypothetical protein VF721_00530 [Pyrinomonadaceae bacterium]
MFFFVRRPHGSSVIKPCGGALFRKSGATLDSPVFRNFSGALLFTLPGFPSS